MNSVVGYKLIRSSYVKSLEDLVRKELSQGYVPLSGAFVEARSGQYFQTMVRYAKPCQKKTAQANKPSCP